MDPKCFSKTEVTVTQVEVMELATEEMEMIKKHRAEKARKNELDEQFAILRKTLDRIYELNGRVSLPSIGGKYVPWHVPAVNKNTIECFY